ncbi:hypothetical protein H6F87_04785 [Cyanobacteria bacterium FACHB-502]|nr:hypothetical protein [Cyanobacteria bacterium FACHB-502]
MVLTQQKRAIGIFKKREDLEESLNHLNDSGFPMSQVSVVGKHLENKTVGEVEISDHLGDTKVNKANAIVGDTATISATGFTLLGLSSLALPGLGVIIAAGSLGAAMVATVASTGVAAVAANQLVQALIKMGIPDEKARAYSDELQGGKYLIMVEGTEDEIRPAEEILSNRGMSEWGIYQPAES